MSDKCLEAARISSDLMTLTSFTGQILQDLVPTLVNTATNVTNIRRDSYLALVNSALPQKMAVKLWASNYLGPQLFEPGLVHHAQERLNQRVAAKGQDTLVRSVVDVALRLLTLLKQCPNEA
jgi:hypothetical protein